MGKNYFIVGSCFPAELGGPSNTIHRLVKKLKSDDNVILSTKLGITAKHKSEYDIQFNKLTVVNGVQVRFFDFLISHKFCIRMLFYIVKNIKKDDVLHINSVFYPLSFLIMLICFFKGNRFTLAPRGELIPQALDNSRSKLLYLTLTRWLLSRASKFIVTSEIENNAVREYFPLSEVAVVPNYLDLPPAVASNLEKKENILYLGRLNPHKCIENLILAYQQLNNDIRSRHQLIIAGTGDKAYVDSLKVIAKGCSSIRFVGHVTGSLKYELYSSSKLFVLPSKSENFGNVIIEALYSGTPAVACFNSPWEMLVDYNCGYFIENSKEALHSVINEHFTKDNKQQHQMELNSVHFINKCYLLDSNLEKVKQGFTL